MTWKITFQRLFTLAKLRSLVRRLLFGLGSIALLMILLAFTSLPFHAHRWLGTHGGLVDGRVDRIIVLSGSGMPSGPELMRCHQAAVQATLSPLAEVVLALPKDTTLARAMMEELELRGISRNRVTLLMHGRNTREQAMDAASSLPDPARSTALVTSPAHSYRALRAFRKVGFTHISGAPAFDSPLFTDLGYAHLNVGGKPYVPDISRSTDLRYNIWNRMQLEISCMREYVALFYYKVNGWI